MNDSTSQTSPAWPTRWPKGSFSPGWTFGFIVVLVTVSLAALVFLGILLGIWLGLSHRMNLLVAIQNPFGNVTGFVINGTLQILWEAAIVLTIIIGMPLLTHFSLRGLGFRVPGMRAIGYALVGALGMVIVGDVGSGVIDSLTHTTHPQIVERIFVQLRHQPSAVAFFVFYAAIAQPIAEETLFRIFIFNLGLRYGGFWTGALISGALFGYTHVLLKDADFVTGTLLGISGVILCWVYYRSRNAYASMISHGVFNALSTAALYFAPKLAGG